MKNLLIGVLIGIMLYGQAAKALEISFDQITLKDLYAACALAGAASGMASHELASERAEDDIVNFSWSVANKMIQKRPIRR